MPDEGGWVGVVSRFEWYAFGLVVSHLVDHILTCGRWAGIQLVLRSPHLAPAVHSIASRVLLSMLLVLPRMSPASLSPDPPLHGRVLAKVHEICAELGSGTTSVMSKSLGLVIQASIVDGSEHVSRRLRFLRAYDLLQLQALISSEGVRRTLDLLLHPRVPPLIRSLPHVESLSLFRAEESLEEIDAREALGLGVAEQHLKALDSTENVTIAPPNPETINVQPSPTPASASAAQTILPSKFVEPTPKSPLPLPPSPLPSSSLIQTLTASSSIVPATVQPAPVVVPMDEGEDEGEEDEEMPTMDMSSDSD
jgi:hypothetical protein